jgi:hypothetical protein
VVAVARGARDGCASLLQLWRQPAEQLQQGELLTWRSKDGAQEASDGVAKSLGKPRLRIRVSMRAAAGARAASGTRVVISVKVILHA